MKKFGAYPRARRFTPPSPTRGGTPGAFEKPQEEALSGSVNGLKAAKGEERLVRTIRKGMKKGMVQGFYFRYSPGMPRNVVGWKELDLLVSAGGRTLAISIKGEGFVHKANADKQGDKLNEVIILSRLRKMGYDIANIISIPAESLSSQEQADKIGRSLGVYR